MTESRACNAVLCAEICWKCFRKNSTSDYNSFRLKRFPDLRVKNFNRISIPKSKPREEEICQSNILNLQVFRVCHTMSCEMAGNEFGVSEVYNWLSSISHGLNLERLAPEFERRGFLSKHSLKYMAQNDLEIIINSPDKLLLSEKRILEKELEELKKPPLQPKELFPVPYTGSLQVVNLPALWSERREIPGRGWSRGSRTKLILREESFVFSIFVPFLLSTSNRGCHL